MGIVLYIMSGTSCHDQRWVQTRESGAERRGIWNQGFIKENDKARHKIAMTLMKWLGKHTRTRTELQRTNGRKKEQPVNARIWHKVNQGGVTNKRIIHIWHSHICDCGRSIARPQFLKTHAEVWLVLSRLHHETWKGQWEY